MASTKEDLKNFITVDKLKAAMGSDGWNKLKEMEVDECKNFLNNRITSATKIITNNSYYGKITSSVANVVGVGSELYNKIDKFAKGDFTEVTDMVNNLVNGVVTTVSKRLVTEVSSYVTKLIAIPDTGEMTKKATKKFVAYVASDLQLGKLMQISLNSTPENSEKEQKEERESKFAYFIKKVKKKAGDLAYTASYYAEVASYYATTVSKYMTMGPDWVTEKVNNAVTPVTKLALSYIDIYGSYALTEKAYFVEWVTDEMAYAMIWAYKKTIQKKAQDELKKIKDGKASAEKDASIQISKMKVKLSTKLGVKISFS